MGKEVIFTASTIGELRRILEPFTDETPINSINVEYIYQRNYGGKLRISLLTENAKYKDFIR